VEGSEEYFDESEHVDGFAAEERSSDGEEVEESEGEDGRGPEGSDFAAEEGTRRCRGPEGSDFAAEESCEEGGPDTEEGYEEVWDGVQEALSTMEHEEFDETAEAAFAQGLKRSDILQRHHPKRQCGLRICLVYLYLFISCVQLRLSSEDFQW